MDKTGDFCEKNLGMRTGVFTPGFLSSLFRTPTGLRHHHHPPHPSRIQNRWWIDPCPAATEATVADPDPASDSTCQPSVDSQVGQVGRCC